MPDGIHVFFVIIKTLTTALPRPPHKAKEAHERNC